MKKPIYGDRIVCYTYKDFMMCFGTCDDHPDKWAVRDWRNYDERVGSAATDICASTIREAKQRINELLEAEA